MVFKYKCIEDFVVPELDDFEGKETEDTFKIYSGSVWEKDSPVLESDKDIYLTKGSSWIEINRDLFDLMFVPIN